ncbi:hypothetical protein SCLCIDRAFT_20306 [Scleroderma citrinum Foug A]|uniref:Uncharacterized protein n=1 Tax=Scleroderma citrinum Foug A TaxID=1036808 RepID=A0A0C3E6F4_9AGAM|nr:hypothetical protein SCLCIDRAFT_20306 [Scleroderma citrinum Foug A]
MSSGSNTDNGNNRNGANMIDWQRVASPDLVEQVVDLLELMKRVAKQEAQRKAKEERKKAKEERKKAKEERKKAKEEAKRVAKEETRRLAEEEAKKKAEEDAQKKAEEDAQKRAEFQAQWQADSERKVREKAEVKAATEVMRVLRAQKAGQGEKPKPKRKRTRRAVANAASTEEIEEALGGFSVAGPSTWLDPVAQVLDWKLGEVIVAIDHNTRELVQLRGKMDGFVWEMKRMANHSDQKGKGKARPEETEEEEGKSDNKEDKEGADDVSDADVEGEDAEE